MAKQVAKEEAPFHGLLQQKSWKPPVRVFENGNEARPGYDSVAAHEYEEDEQTFHEKIALLADMLRASTACIAYTGAGISTGAGIADYASGEQIGTRIAQRLDNSASTSTSQPKRPKGPYDYQPTYAHHALVTLYHHGLLHRWFQQNHDGLPQKAGLPQSALNEIHGAWYDPSNPVVKMSGNLRTDLFEDLLQWEENAHLCIAVGTSLSGMNADRLVSSCAERALRRLRSARSDAGPALGGAVIIGFQCTRLDKLASLRIYSTIDRVFQALMQVLALEVDLRVFSLDRALSTEPLTHGRAVTEDVFEIMGYNSRNGLRLTPQTAAQSDAAVGFTLNLQTGAQVKIASGPHKGSIGEVIGKTSGGDYRLLFRVSLEKKEHEDKNYKPSTSASTSSVKKMALAPWNTVLGAWWVLGALKGELPYLPIVPV